jgi:hypothetical protein
MILKLETLERKSEARGAYGLRCEWSILGWFEREEPRFPLVVLTPLVWTPLVLSFVSGATTSLFSAGEMSQVGHILKMTVMKREQSITVYTFFVGIMYYVIQLECAASADCSDIKHMTM